MSRAMYWSHSARYRVTRRTVISGGASFGLAAAFLVSCGGTTSNSGPKSEGRVRTPQDTSKQAKRGGFFQTDVATDEQNIDPLTTSRLNGGFWSAYSYGRPLAEKTMAGGTKTAEYLGDLAESWELSADGLRLLVKVRPDAKWDARVPTNGRSVDSDDAVFSWSKFASQSPWAGTLSHKADKAAGIEAVEKIDNRTYAYKMAYPWSPLYPSLSNGPSFIMPRESEDKFNPRNDIRGSGPWLLEKREPSVSFTWRRNPDWYRKDLPYLDGFSQAIVPEYVNWLAQFRAKNVWSGERIRPLDVLSIINDFPNLNVYRGTYTNTPFNLFFNTSSTSPFLDVRVRRALSMSLDRDAYAEIVTEKGKFDAAGIPLDVVWPSHIGAGWGGYWLDPKAKEIGEGGKYFQHNLSEAKKLLTAAGKPTLNLRMPWAPQNLEEKLISVLIEMMSEAGINCKLEPVDYQTVFLPTVTFGKGNFNGDLAVQSSSPNADPALTLQKHWYSGSPTSRANYSDPAQMQIDATIDKAMKEFDSQKYLALIHESQRQLAVSMPGVAFGANYAPLTPVWPWVMNWDVYRASTIGTGLLHTWVDETKRT